MTYPFVLCQKLGMQLKYEQNAEGGLEITLPGLKL
jgi:hypothetical protein